MSSSPNRASEAGVPSADPDQESGLTQGKGDRYAESKSGPQERRTEGGGSASIGPWSGRREYPTRASKLAVLSAIVAGAIAVEGVEHGWYSLGYEWAKDQGAGWLVVPLSAGIAALGTYLWALAWKFGGVSSVGRKVAATPPGTPRGQRLTMKPGRWDREAHALLQGLSAVAGAVATFMGHTGRERP